MLNLLRLKTSVFAISFKGPSQYSRLIWPVRGNWDVFLAVSLWNLSKYKNIAFYVFLSNESFLFKFLTHLIWKLRWDFLIACRHTSVRLFVRPCDRLSSYVRPSVCPSVCHNTFHIFTFFSRFTAPISTKLGTMHPWVVGIHVCSNDGPRPFSRGDNYEKAIKHWRNLKLFSSTTGQFQPNLAQSIFVWFVQMKGHTLFQCEIITN